MEAQKSTDKEPCPFCGNQWEEEFTFVYCRQSDPLELGLVGQYAVVCSCGAQGPMGDSRDHAVKLWNRRKV